MGFQKDSPREELILDGLQYYAQKTEWMVEYYELVLVIFLGF